MPLLTLHTRLVTVLDAARTLKVEAGKKAQELAGRDASFGELTALHAKCGRLIEEICLPFRDDLDLNAYANSQFADANFNIRAKIVGIFQLLTAIRAAVIALLLPYDPRQQHNDTSVIVNGVAIPAGPYTPTQTAEIRQHLTTINASIPE